MENKNTDHTQGLREYADRVLNSKAFPNDIHIFQIYRCSICGENEFKTAIEHHTGSTKGNFRGIITGECFKCQTLKELLRFTGEHRKVERGSIISCECGNIAMTIGYMERIEENDGIPGFFDEGAAVGTCLKCGNRITIALTD